MGLKSLSHVNTSEHVHTTVLQNIVNTLKNKREISVDDNWCSHKGPMNNSKSVYKRHRNIY